MKMQFIAGAVCPRCAAQDKLRMSRPDARGHIHRECVQCGFRDEMTADGTAPDEPATRVNRPRTGERALAHEEPVERVRFIDD